MKSTARDINKQQWGSTLEWVVRKVVSEIVTFKMGLSEREKVAKRSIGKNIPDKRYHVVTT